MTRAIVLILGLRLRRPRRAPGVPPVAPLPRPPTARFGAEGIPLDVLRPSTGRCGKALEEPTTDESSDDDLPRTLRPEPSRSAI